MTARRRLSAPFLVLTVLATAVAPSAVEARAGNTLTFRLGLSVPMVCRIEMRGSLSSLPGAATTAEEFCNAPAGYRVLAVHPLPQNGERFWFEYGGRRVPASANGTTTLAEEPTAAHRVRPFAVLSSGGQPMAGNVTLQIAPR